MVEALAMYAFQRIQHIALVRLLKVVPFGELEEVVCNASRPCGRHDLVDPHQFSRSLEANCKRLSHRRAIFDLVEYF